MNRISAKPDQSGSLSSGLFKGLLVAATIVSGAVAAEPADASYFITTGTITSGSETGGLFGLPTGTTDLTGDSYSLIVRFDSLGPNYFTTGDGTFADDIESAPGLTGFVTAIVNDHSLTTRVTNSLGSSLIEDMFDLTAANQGYDGTPSTGSYVNVLLNLSCGDVCVPYADLIAPFGHRLGPNDSGTDLYTFEGAGFPAPGTPTAEFAGVEMTSAFLLVPEPASWLLVMGGLLGLGIQARRRRA
jgi:hypothetical protein